MVQKVTNMFDMQNVTCEYQYMTNTKRNAATNDTRRVIDINEVQFGSIKTIVRAAIDAGHIVHGERITEDKLLEAIELFFMDDAADALTEAARECGLEVVE